jgi:hypothetical protein
MKRISNKKITKVSLTLVQISSTLPQETLTKNSSLTFLLKNLLKLGTLSLNLLLEDTLLDLLYQFLDIKIYALFDLV